LIPRPQLDIINRLQSFEIPALVKTRFHDGFYKENDKEFLISEANYNTVLSTLLFLEEIQQEIDIRTYDMFQVSMEAGRSDNYFRLNGNIILS